MEGGHNPLIIISRRRKPPPTKAIFFSANQMSYCFSRLQRKAIVMRSLYILSFCSSIMPPAVVFLEEDSQLQEFYGRDDDGLPSGGENWDDELLTPGRMVYMGQGVSQFLPFDQPTPGLLYPKRRKKKKKKKATSPQLPPPPEPEPAPLSPAPIDWEDWEELCQFGPPPPPPAVPWEPEDWDAEIAASQWQPEDWEAEIAASQWQPEDWDAEIAASQ